MAQWMSFYTVRINGSQKIYLIKIMTKGNLNLYDQLINYKKQLKEDVYEKPPNCNTIDY